MKVYPADLGDLLEFQKVLAEIEKRCVSRPGKERVWQVKPVQKAAEVRKMLAQTAEMMQIEWRDEPFPFEATSDNREALQRLTIDQFVLPAEDLHQIRRLAVVACKVIRFLNERAAEFPQLAAFCHEIPVENAIAKAINLVLDDDGALRSDASAELSRIRKSRDSKNKELDRAFGAALRQYRAEGKLSEVEESMRNNRRVLGIASEYKRQVKGIIHDESETGKTTFIEPEAVVHIQNELFELEREEQREIYRILKNLTSLLAPYRELLQQYHRLLSIIDLNRAKARYAIQVQAFIPHIADEPVVRLYQARHPVLARLLEQQQKKVVPLDVEMTPDHRIVIISGPNAGGKSVAMKTIGLLVMMAHAGIPITASDHSVIGFFSGLMADIGDSQSLEDELSTYSSRLMKMKHFLQHAKWNTLLLIDEFGTGTDPAMGGAIAEASLLALQEKKVFAVITTHYANLKSLAEQQPGMVNASMLYDETALKPMYRLEMGKPGSSYAIEIATKSQLPAQLIEKARTLVSKEHVQFEQLLKAVRIEKEHLKLREKDLNRKEKELKDKEAELKQRIQKNREKEAAFQQQRLEKQQIALLDMEATFKQYLKEVKEAAPARLEEAKEKLRSFLREKRREQQAQQQRLQKTGQKKTKSGTLTEGSWVLLTAQGEPGYVESIRGQQAVVVIGHLKSVVPIQSLTQIDEPVATSTFSKTKVKLDDETTETELDIRGLDKFEAMTEVEKFLDSAMMRHVFQARIIHGIGTGVLREAVHQMAKSHPGVRKFQPAVRENGGPGVTIVEFV